MLDLQPRKRLFRRLAELRAGHPAIWIEAPAGSGKTSLLVSYVVEHKVPVLWYRVDEGDRGPADLFYYMRRALQAFERSVRAGTELPSFSADANLPHFARRFFEALFGRLPPKALLVLDDYHLAPEESPWQLALEKAIGTVPDGTNIVALSRRPPPAALARPLVHGEIGVLDGAELLLTEAETLALARRRSGRVRAGAAQADPRRVHAAAGGWAAGVSLLLRHERPEIFPALSAEKDVQPVFDYLASAVFSELPLAAQQVLLHAACLPRFSARQAAALSGVARAGEELRALYRSGLFLECDDAKEGIYHFHPLFHSFLSYRAAQTLGDDGYRAARARAAALLRADGHDEDAFDLLLELGDIPALLGVVLARAPALFAEGRITLLDRWIAALPQHAVQSSGWLSYWRAMCALTAAPATSRAEFERALDRFTAERDGAGAYLAWAGAAHALTYEARTWRSIESWFARLADIERFCPVFPSADVGSQVASALLMGLTLAGAEPSKLEEWAERALSLAENTSDPTVRVMTTSVLLLHHALHGDSGRTAALVAKLEERRDRGTAGFVARVAAQGAMAALAWHQGNVEAGLSLASQGLTLMGEQPVPMWQSALLVFGGMSARDRNDLPLLRRFIRDLSVMAESGIPLEVSAYHVMRGAEAMARGQLEAAMVAIELSLDSARAVGFTYGQGGCLGTTAYLAFELGQRERALESLAALARLEEEYRDPMLGYWRLVIEADRALSDGDRAAAVALLRRAFATGRERQIFAHYSPPPQRIAALCVLALQEEIEPQYTKALIRRRKLAADPPPLGVTDWPWPVKIRTLGGFEIRLEDEAISLGRARTTPLLLKTIVALGTGGRGVATSRIAAALWPDADGDAANHAFEMTLSRLRKQFGAAGPEALRLEGEKLSLDRALCWTDVHALEVLLAEVSSLDRALPADGSQEPLRALAERLLALYAGPFAADDDLPPALVAFDKRLQSRVSAAALALGRRLEKVGDSAGAHALYLEALEADPRLSSLLGPALQCLTGLGRLHEARAVAEQWRHRLAEEAELSDGDDLFM